MAMSDIEVCTFHIDKATRMNLESKQNKYYPDIPFDNFLAHLVRLGLKQEEIRIEEDEVIKKARIKRASMIGLSGSESFL